MKKYLKSSGLDSASNDKLISDFVIGTEKEFASEGGIKQKRNLIINKSLFARGFKKIVNMGSGARARARSSIPKHDHQQQELIENISHSPPKFAFTNTVQNMNSIDAFREFTSTSGSTTTTNNNNNNNSNNSNSNNNNNNNNSNNNTASNDGDIEQALERRRQQSSRSSSIRDDEIEDDVLGVNEEGQRMNTNHDNNNDPEAEMNRVKRSTKCTACEHCEAYCALDDCEWCRWKTQTQTRNSRSSEGGVAQNRRKPAHMFTCCDVERLRTKARERNEEESSEDDKVWLVANGNVYEASAFVKFHPAGREVMMKGAIRDNSEDFEMHSKRAREVWRELKVGELVICPEKGFGNFKAKPGIFVDGGGCSIQ